MASAAAPTSSCDSTPERRRPSTSLERAVPSPGAGAPGRYRPIGDYAFLGDCHTGALVSSAGSVDWLCLPRLDDGSYFGRLLDRDRGGWCAITPIDPVIRYGRATWTARWCWRPRRRSPVGGCGSPTA